MPGKRLLLGFILFTLLAGSRGLVGQHEVPRFAPVVPGERIPNLDTLKSELADFGYNGKADDAWVDSASAPAIPGTLRLYKQARHLGVSVFFLTGRAETERAATERNLRGQGFDGGSN